MRRTLLTIVVSLVMLGAVAGSASAAYEFYMWVDGVQGGRHRERLPGLDSLRQLQP